MLPIEEAVRLIVVVIVIIIVSFIPVSVVVAVVIIPPSVSIVSIPSVVSAAIVSLGHVPVFGALMPVKPSFDGSIGISPKVAGMTPAAGEGVRTPIMTSKVPECAILEEAPDTPLLA